MGSGCTSPPLKLYKGQPRPADEVATLRWVRVGKTGHSDVGPGIPLVCAIDGERLSDWDRDAGCAYLLPGEHVIVVAYGLPHFIRLIEEAFKAREARISVNLEAGREYRLQFYQEEIRKGYVAKLNTSGDDTVLEYARVFEGATGRVIWAPWVEEVKPVSSRESR